jgi:hypothetical protein
MAGLPDMLQPGHMIVHKLLPPCPGLACWGEALGRVGGCSGSTGNSWEGVLTSCGPGVLQAQKPRLTELSRACMDAVHVSADVATAPAPVEQVHLERACIPPPGAAVT